MGFHPKTIYDYKSPILSERTIVLLKQTLQTVAFGVLSLLQGRQNIRAAGKRSSVFFYHYILVAAPGGEKGDAQK